jgi:hypothetical protein
VPDNEPAVSARDAGKTTVAAAKPEFQSTSYIERYAHLFADDNATNEKSAATAPSQPLGGGVQNSRNTSAASPSTPPAHASSDGDEESIEQYMNKLLQRVRGQSAGPAASQAPRTANVPKAPLAHQPMTTGQPAGATTGEPSSPSGSAFAWAASFGAGRQKSSTPAPKTDLEALRALANESARRAISRHALRKLRRNALTKTIVSTLAGVTSLWLILESAHWRSLQCITAGVALLVAAYWAGQTYRTLLESLREKAYDEEDGLEESTPAFHSPLPIDVDKPAT